MLNYAVDPRLLAPHVPAGTELDAYGGVYYASLVGFLFERTRVLGVPIPWHRNFEEVNLRFYVRRIAGPGSGPEDVRRGVVFLREIVPRRAIAAAARLFYNENYIALPMSHRLEGNRVEYGWRYGGAWNYLRLETAGDPAPAEPGSLEEFITEHYWGYTRQRDGGAIEYRVEHPRWRLWQTRSAAFAGDAEKLYGQGFAAPLARAPESAFLAEGSEVTVYRGVSVSA